MPSRLLAGALALVLALSGEASPGSDAQRPFGIEAELESVRTARLGKCNECFFVDHLGTLFPFPTRFVVKISNEAKGCVVLSRFPFVSVERQIAATARSEPILTGTVFVCEKLDLRAIAGDVALKRANVTRSAGSGLTLNRWAPVQISGRTLYPSTISAGGAGIFLLDENDRLAAEVFDAANRLRDQLVDAGWK